MEKHIQLIKECVKYSIDAIQGTDYTKYGMTHEQGYKVKQEKLKQLYNLMLLLNGRISKD